MKAVRIVTRTGEIGVHPLGPFDDLRAWWDFYRADGSVVGENWACRFTAIDHAKLIELSDEWVHATQAPGASSLDALTKALARGFHPPGCDT